jgi:hypothetical protein
MSVKMYSVCRNLSLNLKLLDEIQLDHSHGIMNNTTIMTAKHNKIEITNKINLNRDIL